MAPCSRRDTRTNSGKQRWRTHRLLHDPSASAVQVFQLPDGQFLFPIEYLMPVHDARPAAATPSPCCSQKRKRVNDELPYIKKPPNAFLLFLKEQRAAVVAELGITGSAAVNTVLGERWRSLSSEQQAKYFQEANQLRRQHEQQYPHWSSMDNYVRTLCSGPEEEEEAPEEHSSQQLWSFLFSARDGVDQPPAEQPPPASTCSHDQRLNTSLLPPPVATTIGYTPASTSSHHHQLNTCLHL
ncbi:transcription factor 7-like 1 [Melanotaenia boesemani]|uniref:transcription factor 7-like 1 n=1 Tax=Melanotaenia boesemani TaxID=1250792 RepID=UPI001C046BF5|nr:transcription factor 7-like 1 [Melanotaenia boesemani]